MHFNFQLALQIFLETFPFVLARLAVYGLALVATAAWFYLIFLLFTAWPFLGPSWLAWVAGGILYSKLAKIVHPYLLYLLKAAHVGAITRLVVHGELPPGQTLVDYGFHVVKTYFWRISLLFAVDRLVNLILKAFHKSIARLFPFVGGKEGGFLKTFLDYSVGYVDEAIFSYSLARPEQNPWTSAREGLVLYAQNWKTILGSGLLLAAGSYAVVLVVAAPAALLLWPIKLPFAHLWWGIALGVGFLVKFALVDPFALTAIIVNFHQAVAGQRVDPAWEQKLETVSEKFAEIRTLEKDWNPDLA